MAVLPAAVRRLLEAMVTTGTHEYKSDFARRYYGQGKAEGKAEGKVEGEGEAILTVLQERGVALPDELRERIAGCDDLGQLTVWLRRAVTARTAEDLFA